jgi:hypothetical protein
MTSRAPIFVRSGSFRAAAAAWAVATVLGVARPAAAQEPALKSYFEGKRGIVRLDMPGSADGVDVHPDASRPIDFTRYGSDLKRYGTALRSGDSAPVTLVKVKKDLIELHLAGGGFGTFSDDTSTSASIPNVDKSQHEKDLEKRVKGEDDRDRRRRLQNELDEVRQRRERENRRIAVERERIEEIKRERIAERRLRGGSRFNLRYKGGVPPDVRPEDVVAALAEYIDFGGRTDARDDVGPPGDISLLRKGMSRAEAELAFGRPIESSQRRDAGLAVTTLVFDLGEQRVAADFVEDVLVRYTITSK